MKSTPIVKRYLNKYYLIYELLLAIVLAFECGMTVYGLIRFDLSRSRDLLYFSSYLLLLFASLVSLLFLEVNRKKRTKPDYLVGILHTYCAAIVVWAALVSYLDITAGNSAIVYQTVLMSVGCLVVMSPVFFLITVAVTATALFVCLPLGGVALESGFVVNFIVFIVMSVFIAIRNYRANATEYKATRELNRLSFTDQLTATNNRRSMDRYLTALHSIDRPYTFMLVDVDNFKTVNDSYGHEVGDKCLVIIAALLKERFVGHIYRYGGDEFAVVSAEMPETVAEKLSDINADVKERLSEYGVQLSAGIYRRERGEELHTVIQKTDKALYTAKSGGKGIAVVYSPILN